MNRPMCSVPPMTPRQIGAVTKDGRAYASHFGLDDGEVPGDQGFQLPRWVDSIAKAVTIVLGIVSVVLVVTR